MRRTTLTYAISMLVLVVGCVWLFFPPWTRTNIVEIVAIGEGYDIRIRSDGRYLLPLSPEGPFPKWGQETRFLAQGPGERQSIDGVPYKKYTLGKDLETTWLSEMFAGCEVFVSEEAQRLIVQGELTAERKSLINHSGTYNGITIDHVEIFALDAHSTIDELDHRYIRAKGDNRDGRFETAGKTFASDLWQEGEFEVVGCVFHRSSQPPFLEVSSYKRVSPD